MSKALPPPVNLETFADKLKVLAEPKRLLIINLLMEGVQCNCELGGALQMAPNLISHHLSVLRQAGLVDMERDPLDFALGILLGQPRRAGGAPIDLWRILRCRSHQAASAHLRPAGADRRPETGCFRTVVFLSI